MLHRLSILLVIVFLANKTYAQRIIRGQVYEKNSLNKEGPFVNIALANVYWQGTFGTTANEEGKFKIEEPSAYPSNLIVSFVGFQTDTIRLNSYKENISVFLKKMVDLEEFQVQERQSSSFISTIDPHHTETLTSKELEKAACCNVSESFETNATVDVNLSDAISGVKKIQLLGLDGIYTQIQWENLPLIRGLSSAYGLTYIPGTWVESIQIKKGAGSVINGYESITGQINLELKKPDESERLYINLHGNAMSRTEVNVYGAQELNPSWSTLTLAHYSTQNIEHDNNNDNFHDHPLRTQYNIFNRWKYKSDKRVFQAGIRGVYEDLSAGQIKANPLQPLYYIGIKTKQFEAFVKNGFLFPDSPYKSIGILSSFKIHDHESKYGPKSFIARQYSGYLNLIYQTILGQTDHGIKFGGSWAYDNYDKYLNSSLKFGRVEYVPGLFTEYSYNNERNSILVMGLRGDHHNKFGFFLTPRVHYKYDLRELSVLRFSAGRGFRTANPIIENSQAMASGREIKLDIDLKPEVAWNYGSSLTHQFYLAQKEMGISLDYYFTHFENQIVVDIETPRVISFYNLEGKSYSNSLQIEYSIRPIEPLELKAAYKWYNIRTLFTNGLRSRPLIPTNRVLLNTNYSTPFDKWKLDLTLNWFGPSRIPRTLSTLGENIPMRESHPFYTINGQVTRSFKQWDIYIGVENILDYKQSHPIIAPEDPNGSNFDASLIWGPIFGRNIYIGLRYNIK